MFRQILRTFVGIVTVAVAGTVLAGPESLSKKQRDTLAEYVVPAFRAGDPRDLLESLSPLVSRANGATVDALDGELAEHGVPAVRQLLAEARFALMRQGVRDHSDLKGRELVLTLAGQDERLESILQWAQRQPLMQDPLPLGDDFFRYERIFWNGHVLDNQFEFTQQLAAHCRQLTQLKDRLTRVDVTAEEEELFGKDFEQLGQRIAGLRRDLAERLIELRVFRLADAEAVLRDSQDAERRLLAAFVIDMDGDRLREFLEQKKGENRRFGRELLNDPGLADTILEVVESGRENAADALEKSRLLFTGLHWWLRGRYGLGPEGGGLLKSRFVLTNPQAQLFLLMPKVPPQPTDPAQSSSPRVPTFDRRHHYTWAWQDRQLSTHQTSQSTTSKISGDPYIAQEFFL